MNAWLSEQVVKREDQVVINENDLEDIKQYLHRDLLEIHGAVVTQDENTNAIVKDVAQIIDPNMDLNNSDISISHHLKTAVGFIPAIIMKFTRHDVRDKMLKMKSNPNLKTTIDVGYWEESCLFINKSLTQKSRELLREVKSFNRKYHYKFVWTKHGKC